MTPEVPLRYQRENWKPFKINDELLRRAKVLDAAEKDPELRDGFIEMCRLDIAFFINNFCWIYEPRAGMEHNVPWILYPHEYLFIDFLEERLVKQEDGLVEKSRDMGATWTAVGWLVHHFLFDDEFSVLIGSKKEEDVDNKLPDSIFGKIDYLLDHLPWWMMPVGWKKDKNRNYLKITHPKKLNAITGESTNPNFSRSGRYTVIILDEFAHVERSFSIWQATADSSSVRIPISTPMGKGNKFEELAHNGQIAKLSVHWRLHPEKDDAWYAKEKTRRTDEEIAQELDISYERSQRGRVYKNEWDELVSHKRLTDVTYDPFLPVDTSWDFGIGDETAITFYQEMKDKTVKIIDYYENSGFSIDHYLKVVQDKPYRYFRHYGDFTITRKELGTGRSVWEIMKSAGITIRGKHIKNKQDSINAVKMMLRQTMVSSKLAPLIDAFENYHYEWNEEKQVFNEEPVHDWCSHAMDSVSYYAVNRQSYKETMTKPTLLSQKDRYATSLY